MQNLETVLKCIFSFIMYFLISLKFPLASATGYLCQWLTRQTGPFTDNALGALF